MRRLARAFADGAPPPGALSEAQRLRAVLPAYWRGAAWRRSQEEGLGPTCRDKWAGPLAEALLPEGAAAALEASPENALEAQVAGAHCVFVDHMVHDVVGRRFRKAVFVGSGMDTRAYRLSVPPMLIMVEIEEQAVLSAKAKVLETLQHRAHCRLTQLPTSGSIGSDGWFPEEELRATLGLDPAPSHRLPQRPVSRRPQQVLFVVDAAVSALPSEALEDLLGKLLGVAGSGSRLVVLTQRAGAQDFEAHVASVQASVAAAGWDRITQIGQKILGKAFRIREAPPDSAALIIVAEHGQMERMAPPLPVRKGIPDRKGAPRPRGPRPLEL